MSARIRPAAFWSVLLLSGACAKGIYVPDDAGTTTTNADANATTKDASAPLDAQIMNNDAGDPDANATDAGADGSIVEMCPATKPCQNARSFADVKGDEGAETSTATGKGSEWLALTVTDKGGIIPTENADKTLKAKIILTSPTGSNYDLFVHQPSAAGGHTEAPRDCSVAPISSQNAVMDDVVSLSWDDERNSSGQSAGDGLILSIEVRHVSGSCDGQWTLTVLGNSM